MKYFPLLRGKQNEVLTLRSLANQISSSKAIVPILEPVNWNSTTQKGIREFVEKSMRFLLICNPKHGEYSSKTRTLWKKIYEIGLMRYQHWVPSMYVYGATGHIAINEFCQKFGRNRPVAFVYYGKPYDEQTLREIQMVDVAYHVFVADRVDSSYTRNIRRPKRVLLRDSFHRQRRNADYPAKEFFSDMNTSEGNPESLNFGDFSIVGDFFQERGGPPHAVTLHHIHFDSNSNNLMISHFISDQRETPLDRAGKTSQAITNLVRHLDALHPNDTQACDRYKELFRSKHSTSLGALKGLAIKQHFETILSPKGLGH